MTPITTEVEARETLTQIRSARREGRRRVTVICCETSRGSTGRTSTATQQPPSLTTPDADTAQRRCTYSKHARRASWARASRGSRHERQRRAPRQELQRRARLGLDQDTGKRRQKWHSGYRTKREAAAALADLDGSVNHGVYVAKTRQTVADFSLEWLAAIEPTVRPASHYSYARNLRLHVLPYVGSTPLVALDAGSLNGLYAKLLANGRRDFEGGGLSPVRYVHTIVHRLCKDAVKWARLARNPADVADPPRSTASGRPEMVTWTAGELGAFLDGVRADRLYAGYVLLATSGMRRGEALGLRWTDLSLDAGRAPIRQTVIAINHGVQFGTPKTAKSRRTVTLDAVTVAALREHRQRQLAERLLTGAGWTDHGLVFARVDGGPEHPERFSRSFARHIAHLSLPAIRLHDLRHGWATMALEAGVHPKILQERLGHANVGITLDVYSHVSAGLHSDAAERVAGLSSDRLVSNPLADRPISSRCRPDLRVHGVGGGT